jgi:hypothetical protein
VNNFSGGIVMYEMGKFKADYGKPKREGVDTYDDVSREMDIFQRSEEQFLPPGKDFKDLTPKELEHLKRRYRFDYYKPGVYQGITWVRNNSNHHGI